ncbi:hypothetical protein SDC9_117303 [bioreactor metagenome]|uniref:Uncharacterized protein n=1 Tax=bioreactor metagenome TaxID=1076179 RepID=A0A645BZ19_9ZZZZ
MHPILGHVHAAKIKLQIAPRKLVVVARNEDHARALARLAQQLLHHIVVRLRPVPLAAQLPAVDDVAHQEQRLALGVLEEIQQRVGLAAGRSQVQVRDPQGAKTTRRPRRLEHVTLQIGRHGRRGFQGVQHSIFAFHEPAWWAIKETCR